MCALEPVHDLMPRQNSKIPSDLHFVHKMGSTRSGANITKFEEVRSEHMELRKAH